MALKEHIGKLEEKLTAVSWYIEVTESGGDMKEVMNLYEKSKLKTNLIKSKYKKQLSEVQEKVKDL